jgi:hypothetical protein
MDVSALGELTQKKHIARFSLLHAESVCGNFSGYVLLPKIRVGTFSVLWNWQSAAPRGFISPYGNPSPLTRSQFGRGEQAYSDFPGSARYERDKQQKNADGNPPSEHKKSELPRRLLFTLAAS